MVGVFVRLKLRALRNTLHGRAAAVMAIGGVIGLLAAFGTIALGAAPFERPGAAADLLSGAYAVWLTGWIIAPIATGGGDATLRPEHFALLPIGRARLASGLLAAAFLTVPAVVTTVAFCGLIVFGARFGAGTALLGALFAAAGPVIVVLAYRVVMAALGGLMSSRKGKDLALVFVALAALSGVAVNYVAGSLGPALAEGRASGLAGVLRVLPTGWGPSALEDAADGRWGAAIGLLAASAVLIAVLIAAWGALLGRESTTAPSRGRGAATETRARTRMSPSTPVGAVVVKELRCWWRDSRRRLALAGSVIIGVVIIVAPAVTGGGGSGAPMLPFLGAFVVAFAGMQAGNLYGYDGGALWHTIVTPGAYRADVRGRQLAWAMIVGPVGLALAAVLPGTTGHPGAYPSVFAVVPALLGAGAGIVVLQSVHVPFPLPDPRHTSNPFAANGRPGLSRTLLILGFFLLLAVTAVPAAGVALAGRLAGVAALEWAAVPVGVGTGAVLAWWWGRAAAARLSQRAPELLAVVAKEP